MEGNPAQRFFDYLDADPDDACFFWTGGPVELAERTWFASQGAGVVAFETDEGLVLVDTGPRVFAEEIAQRIRSRTDAPIHTVIYTHGHIDHAFALDFFLAPGQAPPRIIGHAAMAERFARYDRTKRHNHLINVRQFGGTPTEDDMDSPEAVEGFGIPEMTPDTYYDEEMTIEVGGLTFELTHCRGETDDHTWVYCREREVLCPGDLFIWAVPNAGNPQKAQRYPWDWAAGLREMASQRPASMGSGHGGYVVNDVDRLQTMLVETADYLDSLVSQTIDVMEHGSPPHVDVLHAVEAPETDRPWLRTLYDDPEFVVRNTIRYYGGWYTGRPSELKPASRVAVASEVAALAGGAAALAQRARELTAAGETRIACHLADYALEAAPEDQAVQAAVSEVYDSRADDEPGLMSTNLFRSAAAYARDGRPYA